MNWTPFLLPSPRPMSEHQVYEFLAIDAPLSARQMTTLRAISTRAEITPTRFFNEYHWGDLRAKPLELMRRYFDVCLHQFNSSCERLMLRMPAAHVDGRTLRQYFRTRSAQCIRSGRHFIVDISTDDEGYGDDFAEVDVATVVALRAELLLGDLRACYLVWLASVQREELEEEAKEPSVPPGLATPSAAQHALARLLRLEPSLLRAAAKGSAPLEDDCERAKAWVRKLPNEEKVFWLEKAVSEPHVAVGAELLAHFRKTSKSPRVAPLPRRSVSELLAALKR